MVKFKSEDILQRGRGIGGFLKFHRNVFRPSAKKKSKTNNLGYYDNCRAFQQYGRVLHEMEKGQDNKGFVSDE